MIAGKIDLSKLYKSYYTATTTPAEVALDAGQYITIMGQGEPAGATFTAKVQALYSVAYTVKAIYKRLQEDFTVSKLEGLWWTKNGQDALKVPKNEWCWKLMIRIPAYTERADIEQAIGLVLHTKKLQVATEVRFEKMKEGLVVQCMHLGNYDSEPATIALLHAYMEEKGYEQDGLHHEIYLSDPNKVVPEKWKTIIRIPVKRKDD
ncbi:hypothetical protein LX64_02904 [Chitinophaga skermanii]|uniref:GyrI-like small molecule binding domain-containing protein n=1 Tax=Chitinophaga skermanii TaxID=331697 RepID=A0A327QQG9_9BACT|nr:GyrI-like domain-containing protein [Chitinophaga skermanii]RAJ04027.1 hypothetical protein LX64_02904 [Chitinophaga skermanii]